MQNYGFELVMQFNEYHQRKRQRGMEEERRRREGEAVQMNRDEFISRDNQI